jgi:hypothetical protein
MSDVGFNTTHSPLVEPDMKISLIRLSQRLSSQAIGRQPRAWTLQVQQTHAIKVLVVTHSLGRPKRPLGFYALRGACSRPLLRRRYQASSSLAHWPLSFSITRPKQVRLRCGSRVRFARLRQWNYSHSRLLSYLSNGQPTRYPPFTILDRPGLSWHTKDAEYAKENQP